MLARLNHADFARCLNETFRLDAGDSALAFELVRTDCLAPAGPRSARQPFSLVFRGPREPLLPQRIYRLEHPQIGAFDAFLVPIGPDAEGQRYELIFA